jgi:hypothetical protein
MKLYRICVVPKTLGTAWQVKIGQVVVSAGTSPADACARVADCRKAQEVASRRFA